MVFVLVLLVAPVVLPHCFSGVTLNGLLRVDAFEDTTFLHCVVGLGMKLAWPLQRFVVVFLIITSLGKPFDCVDFVVVVMRSFTSEIDTVVTAPVPPLFGGCDCHCTKGCSCRNIRGCVRYRPIEEAARFVGSL